MKREEFINQLELLLTDISKEEREEAIAFYNGYFEDAGEENEEDIIHELISPEQVARTIKADLGIEEEKEYTEHGYEDQRFQNKDFMKAESERPKESRTSQTLLIVILVIITSPIWLALLGTLVGLAIATFATIFALGVSMIGVVVALMIVSVALIGAGIAELVVGAVAIGMGLLGTGCILFGIAMLGLIASVYICGKFIPWVIKEVVGFASRLLNRRRGMV